MCGHFGIAGIGIQKPHLRVLNQLGLVSMLRGVDSTGICQINTRMNNPSILLEKEAMDFLEFSNYHQYHKEGNRKVMSDLAPDVFIGHVRAATIGVINSDNAHPFEFPNLVGAHNGTLTSPKYSLDKNKTDSEQMFSAINEEGILPVLNELSKDDAYAIVMYDKSNKRLYFARSVHRSFWMTFSKKASVMFWASEKWMLEGILSRCNEEHTDFYTLNPNTLYELPVRDIVRGKTDVFFSTKLEEKKEVVRETRSFWGRAIDNWEELWKEEEKDEEEKKTEVVKKESEKPVSRVQISTCEECDRLMYPIDRYYGMEVTSSADEEPCYVCAECTDALELEDVLFDPNAEKQVVTVH